MLYVFDWILAPKSFKMYLKQYNKLIHKILDQMVNKMLPNLKSEIQSWPAGGTDLEQEIPGFESTFLRFGICANLGPTYGAESIAHVFCMYNPMLEKKN